MLKYINYLKIIIRVVWWALGLFLFSRMVYLYFHQSLSLINLKTIIAPLLLDFSMAFYCVLLLLLIFILKSIFNAQSTKIWSFIIVFFGVIYSMVNSADMVMYKSWNSKINNRALTYAEHPKEAFLSSQTGMNFSVLFLLILQILAAYLLYRLLLKKHLVSLKVPRLNMKVIATWILTAFISFWAARGSIGKLPIGISSAYYSNNSLLNAASVNSLWNFIFICVDRSKGQFNEYSFYEDNEVESKFKEHYGNESFYHQGILNTEIKKPNIVFIILESNSTVLLDNINSDNAKMPFMSALAKNGYYCSNAYSSGFRTDQGVASILSGYAGMPNSSIMFYPDKASSLNSISKALYKNNYATSFYYGGDLGFANMEAYIINQKFNNIKSEKTLPKTLKRGEWGINDAELLNYYVNKLDNEKEPFFSTVLSLSLHPPYDVLKNKKESDAENFYLTAKYVDDALAMFFAKAKNKKWYKNTLFCLVADHSTSIINKNNFNNPIAFNIPIILYGEALKDKFKGYVNPHLVMQTDIPQTILNELLFKDDIKFSYHWSDTAQKEFAYSCSSNMAMYQADSAWTYYDFGGNQYNKTSNGSEILEQSKSVKSIAQWFQNDFNNR